MSYANQPKENGTIQLRTNFCSNAIWRADHDVQLHPELASGYCC